LNAEWSLAAAFLASRPTDAARVLERASPVTSAAVLSRCAPRVFAEALRQMDPAEASAVLARLPGETAPGVLAELSHGPVASMLRPLDPAERERLLAVAPEETAKSVRTALFHPEGTAGSMMDSNLLALPSEISVGEARQRMRRRSKRAGNYVYVLDQDRRPMGAVSLGELMLASPKESLTSLMRAAVAKIPARAGVDAILAHPGWRGLHALPVVDSDGTLVGVLRRETYERLREEAARREAAGSGGFGLALAELFWKLTASAVDELARAARSDRKLRPVERSDDN
jgi:magnesium transporter